MQNILDKKSFIVELIKSEGPSLPSSISKKVGMTLLFTSALFSEMVADKTLKISYLKIGGSPLYYLPGQEEMLEKYTNHLNSQEKESFEMLKQNQVILEDNLDPVHRVAIKSIKDFASLITISVEGKERNFWKIYSLSLEESQEKIKKILDIEKNGFKTIEKNEKVKMIEKDGKLDVEQKIEKKDNLSSEIGTDKEVISGEIKEGIKEKKRKPKKEKQIQIKEDSIQEQVAELYKGETLENNPTMPVQFSLENLQQIQQIIAQTAGIKIAEIQEKEKQKKPNKKLEEIKEKLKHWIKNKHLEIIQENEDEVAPFIVSTPSTVGNLDFILVYSDKKKISESEVSIAFQKGIYYKMPVMFLIVGELNKKAEEYLRSMGYMNIQKFD